MKKFTRQNKVLAGTAMQLLINYCQETNQKSKQRKGTEITPVLLIDEQKNRKISKGTCNFSPNFKISYLSIPRFLAEHLKMFCGKLMFRRTLDGTHSFRHCIYLRFRQLVVRMPKVTFKFRAKDIGCMMTK
jgi:hypothetical protein